MTFPTNYYLVKNDRPYVFNSLWDHLGFGAEMQKELTVATDVLEEKDQYLLRMDMPGVKEEDLNLQFTEGVLTISGERKNEDLILNKEQKLSYALKEVATGKFKRSFRLNEAIKEEAITASLKDGILSIVIPKTDQKKPKIISVTKS
ncbi:MAG: Hsp20/alpha crystallin family protein [Bacteriovoracaceae bacterium]